MEKTRIMKEISPEWDRFMQVAERLKFGEIQLIINKGKPVKIKISVKDIDLLDENKFKEGFEIILL